MPRVQDYKNTSEEASSSIVFYLANTLNNNFLLIKMGVVWAWLLVFLPIKAAPA